MRAAGVVLTWALVCGAHVALASEPAHAPQSWPSDAVARPLTDAELAAKRRAVAAYQSQVQVMNPFLVQFLRLELFGQLDATQVTIVPREYTARFRRTP